MKKTRKSTFLIAGLLCVAGLVIGLVSLIAVGFDYQKLSTVTFETNTYEITEAFDAIAIDIDIADICFLPSEDGVCKVVCREEEKLKHTATVENGTLVIGTMDTRKWYEYIGMSFEDSDLTIYLPEFEYSSLIIKSDTSDVEMPKDFQFETVTLETDTGEVKWNASVPGVLKMRGDTGSIKVSAVSFGDLDIKTATGNIAIDSAQVEGALTLETDTGKIQVNGATCTNINLHSDTGEITLKNTVASEHCAVESTTGEVSFDGFDAATIVVKNDTGDVTGTLCSEKVFLTQTQTGQIEVPKTTTGGTCEIRTSTGDIEIKIICQ